MSVEEDALSGFVRYRRPEQAKVKGRKGLIGEVVIEIDLEGIARLYGPSVLRSRMRRRRLLNNLIIVQAKNVEVE